MKKNNNTLISRLLKIILSVFLLILLISRVGGNELIREIYQVRATTIAWTFLFWIWALVAGALKWKLLLPEERYIKLLITFVKSQFYSTVLPGQIFGELSKVAILHKGIEKDEKVVASVVSDKVIGLIAAVVLGAVGLSFSSCAEFVGYQIICIAIVVVLVLLLYAPRIAKLDNMILVIISKCKGKIIIGRIANLADGIYSAWRVFALNKGLLLKNLLLGVIVQFATIFQAYKIGIDIGINVPLVEYLWIMTIVSFVILLPISFAGVGVRDVSITGLLVMCGASESKAIVVPAIINVIQILVALIGGIVVFIDGVCKQKDE